MRGGAQWGRTHGPGGPPRYGQRLELPPLASLDCPWSGLLSVVLFPYISTYFLGLDPLHFLVRLSVSIEEKIEHT